MPLQGVIYKSSLSKSRSGGRSLISPSRNSKDVQIRNVQRSLVRAFHHLPIHFGERIRQTEGSARSQKKITSVGPGGVIVGLPPPIGKELPAHFALSTGGCFHCALLAGAEMTAVLSLV
mmetsp:Transcript_17452/g.40724  ORF Transcript_17452/g.40724 Transcript_17452/m.40724 type:complete len:119 (+) Transcript_17452:93-449(+)